MASENVQELTESDFDNIVAESELPVLVDFWAEWCPPCKILSPRLENIAKKLKGQLLVKAVDVGESPNTAAKFNVTGIPTLIFFKDGKVHTTIVGAVSEEEILAAFNKLK